MKRFILIFVGLLCFTLLSALPAYSDSLLQKAKSGDAEAQYYIGRAYYDGNGVKKDYNQAFRWFKTAAEQGNVNAQFYVGVYLANGYGLKRNYTQAVSWYKKAAMGGNRYAQNNLGWCYKYGKGVKQNYNEAFRWFKAAAKKGHLLAQSNLGWCYLYGMGVKENPKEAVRLFKMAAEQGYAGAQCDLGFCYELGIVVEPDYFKALYWATSAAEQGYLRAISILGPSSQQLIKKNYNKSSFWIKAAAEQGDAASQYNMGFLYDRAIGVKHDYNEAFWWFKNAAENNYFLAMYEVAWRYEQGIGTPKNASEALKWYRLADYETTKKFDSFCQEYNENYNLLKEYVSASLFDFVDNSVYLKWIKSAANKNFSNAQYILGCLNEDIDNKKNNKKAFKYYKKAAKNGNYFAQYRLANIYEYGRLNKNKNIFKAIYWYKKAAKCQRDWILYEFGRFYDSNSFILLHNKAINWFNAAAQKGNINAQMRLACLYENGDRVKQDFKEAYYWYLIAYRNGNKNAEQDVKRIENKLTDQQKQEVQARVNDWFKTHPKE
jgi:hypothetical protein